MPTVVFALRKVPWTVMLQNIANRHFCCYRWHCRSLLQYHHSGNHLLRCKGNTLQISHPALHPFAFSTVLVCCTYRNLRLQGTLSKLSHLEKAAVPWAVQLLVMFPHIFFRRHHSSCRVAKVWCVEPIFLVFLWYYSFCIHCYTDAGWGNHHLGECKWISYHKDFISCLLLVLRT